MKNLLKIGAAVLALLMFTACALGQAPVLRQYYTTNPAPVIASGITVLARVEAQDATNSLYNVLPHLGGFNTWGDNNVFNSGVEFNGTFASILGGVFGEAAKYSSNIFQIKGSGNYFNVGTDGALWGGAARFGSSVWGNNMRSTNAFYIDNAKMTAAGNKIVAESGFQGDGQSITLNSAGFVGNLNSGDNTLQEIAQKLDSLTVPGLPTGVITQNQTSVTLGEPFLLRYPTGGPYYWQFDILPGGGHDLEISQIDSGSRVVFDDSGGITASGGFAGNGASVTNLDGANIQVSTINSNKFDDATLQLLGGDVTAAMLAAATNTTYQDSTNWSKDGTHITTGQINPSRLGTGSSITSKFLKGDGTWASISSTSYDGTGIDDLFVQRIINSVNGNSYIYFGQDFGDGTGTTVIGGSDGIHMNHLVTFEAGATMDGTVYIADMTNTVQKVGAQFHPYTNSAAVFDGDGKLVAGTGQTAGNVFGDRAVWNGSAWEDDSRWIHFENEFLLSSTAGYPMATFGTGTGAGINAVDVTSNRVGVVTLAPGTTATGYYGSCVGSASIRAFSWGQGEEMVTDLTCYVDTLSDNTENYAFQFGYMDGQITNAPADGVFWQYSNGTNSGNWQIVSRNSTTTTNVYDIGTNVVARRWYDLRLKTATDGTSSAYLDGVLVKSGIAATSGQVIPLFRINKAAGTTDRPVRLDYYRWAMKRAATKYQ